MNIIIGLILIFIGYTLLAKTEGYLSNFGRIEFFEKYLGSSGGSRLGYKFVGILFITGGVFAITGLWYNFLTWLFSPLTKYN